MINPSHFTAQRPKNGLIGHRGLAALAPENTIISFTLAKVKGLDWVEFDIQLTKDDALVIFHDDTLERTTNGHGLLYNHTLAELTALDAGTWFHRDFHSEKIPVFAEVLPQLWYLGLFLNIELKLPENPTPEHSQRLANAFMKILKTWPTEKPLPLVSSFHWPTLDQVKAQFPILPVGYLCEVCTPLILKTIAQIPNAACHTNYESLSPMLISQAKAQNTPLLAYTVNDVTLAKNLLNQGVFAIFSDFPLDL